jgi:hypothetical protein
VSDGARVAELYRVGEVIAREQDGAMVDLTVRLESWHLDRLRDDGIAVSRAGAEAERRAG